MKNRLADPSEICALEFKGEFRRFKICSISATIGIDWSIFDIRAVLSRLAPSAKRTVTARKSLNDTPALLARSSSHA
jgi:hypothetical protein